MLLSAIKLPGFFRLLIVKVQLGYTAASLILKPKMQSRKYSALALTVDLGCAYVWENQ